MEARLGARMTRLAAIVVVAALSAAGCAAPADDAAKPGIPDAVTSAPVDREDTTCTPTAPNGDSPPGEPPSPEYLGNGRLFTVLWPDGVVVFEPGGPGEIRDNGSLAMKWPFWRGEGAEGRLTIQGRSLHRPGLSTAAEIPEGYGAAGFQATALVFPEAGCWEITARAGKASLTFVTKVELRE